MQELNSSGPYGYLAIPLLLGGCLLTIFADGQSDTTSIYGGYFLASLGYLIVCYHRHNIPWKWLLAAAIIVRLASIGHTPQLSDDVYRFIWDGRLIHHGISPYADLPSTVVTLGLSGLDDSLYELLNSPAYYSIYPPLSQVMYYMSTWPEMSVNDSIIVLQCIHLIGELIGAYLLYRLLILLGKGGSTAISLSLLYYLCPLVVVEGVGNLHHEVITCTCVIASLYCLQKGNYVLAGLPILLGVGIKLIPAILIPYLFLRLRGRIRLAFSLLVVVLGIGLLAPILVTLDLQNFGASLDLYFRRFEYNASLYYLLRWIGKIITGYNLIAYIGPILGIITIASVLTLVSRDQYRTISTIDTSRYILYSLTIYYLCATTVHPWYIINLIPVAIITGYRYPMVWATLIPLTYINYSYEPFHENLFVVAIEYSILLSYVLWEDLRNKKGATVAVR